MKQLDTFIAVAEVVYDSLKTLANIASIVFMLLFILSLLSGGGILLISDPVLFQKARNCSRETVERPDGIRFVLPGSSEGKRE